MEALEKKLINPSDASKRKSAQECMWRGFAGFESKHFIHATRQGKGNTQIQDPMPTPRVGCLKMISGGRRDLLPFQLGTCGYISLTKHAGKDNLSKCFASKFGV